MRLWSLHPRYLDRVGLVALWREALLAKAVLAGRTKGYRRHPQLARFKESPAPRDYINNYLAAVLEEAQRRGYHFMAEKAGQKKRLAKLPVSKSQLGYELIHLKKKLRLRDRQQLKILSGLKTISSHPLFRWTPGPIANWEKIYDYRGKKSH